MDSSPPDIFTLATRRLSWMDRRQQVLAQNIANANTPGYQARDLPDFARTLSGTAQAMAAAGSLEVTNPMHLAGTVSSAGGLLRSARPRERAPDGNAVSMDEELMKVADTQTQHELVTNLYQKYVGMYRTALGRGS